MRVVLEVVKPVDLFGLKVGDTIVLDLGAEYPLSAVRLIPAGLVPQLLDHFDALEVIHQDPPVQSQSADELLRRVVNGLTPPAPSSAEALPDPWPGPPD